MTENTTPEINTNTFNLIFDISMTNVCMLFTCISAT